MRKYCHLTVISIFLLRKENCLNSQDLTVFLGNPCSSYPLQQLLCTVCSSCMLPKKPAAWEDTQNWFSDSANPGLHLKDTLFQPDILPFLDPTVIARKGAFRRKYIPIGIFCISSDVDYEALGVICHTAGGEWMLTPGMTFCCAAQYSALVHRSYNIIISFKNIFCCQKALFCLQWISSLRLKNSGCICDFGATGKT